VYRQKVLFYLYKKRRQKIKSVGVNKTEEGMNKKGSNTAKLRVSACIYDGQVNK